MLLRLYRLSDKIGIIILKLAAACGDWLANSATVMTGVFRRSTGGLFGIILAVLLGLARIVGLFFRALGFLLKQVWGLFKGFAGFLLSLLGGGASIVSRAAQGTARVGGGVVQAGARSATESMARRAAREEIDVTVKEDPLRVQNRRLSFLVLILGVTVIGAILWATDPNRNSQAQPVAFNPPANNVGQNDGTAIATTIANVPATAIPTATALPVALRARGSIVYTVRERAQTDLWAVDVGSLNPIRITNDVADERDPEWSPDGTRLAYASRASGNWDLYVYDILVDAHQRLTVDLSFQANPTWSPDGVYLAYENYQGENLDIYAMPIDGTSPPLQISSDPDPNVPVADFSPAWEPVTGRQIAYVSWREGNQDIFVFDLDTSSSRNITNTPTVNEDYPAWSPDGRFVAYSAWELGGEKVFVRSIDEPTAPPQVLAFGRTPTWSPDGGSIAFAVDGQDGTRTDISAVTFGEGRLPIQIASVPYGSTSPTWSSVPLPPQLINAGGLASGVPEPLYIEQASAAAGADFQLQSLGNVQAENALLSDAVNDSFDALRQRVFENSGVDFLDQLDHAFWSLDYLQDLGDAPRNWHRTGRAFSIPENKIRGFPPPVEVVREEVGLEIYWRIYVRVDENSQRGQLGEPLRRMPWDFLSTTQGDLEAFTQGGRLRREMPAGYYVDFTQIAQDYGWQRLAAGSDWRANTRARNYWMFIKPDGLAWCDAMLQLYTEGELVNYDCTGS